MTDEQKAAYVMAQSVAAMCELEAMKAANAERESNRQAQAYDETYFRAVIDEFNISHNAVLELFRS